MQASVKPWSDSLPASFDSTLDNTLDKNYSSMIDMLEQSAEQHTSKTAFAFLRNGETLQGKLSYGQLHQNAKKLAAFIQQYAKQGDRIVLMLSPGLEYISAFFACLYAGTIAVPAYPPANRRRDGAKLDGLLNDANPSIILTSDKEHQRLEQTLSDNPFQDKILNLSEAFASNYQWQRPININERTIAFLQYTSGSTGSPKGVMVSHGNLLANLYAIHKALKTDENTKCATWLPPYHDMGLIGTLLSVSYVGGSAYIMEPVAFLQQPYRWLKAISDYRITHTAAPNFAFQLAVDKVSQEQVNSLDLSSWQIALTGAEPIREQTLNDFAAHFANANYKSTSTFPAYGLAECTLFATGGQVNTLKVNKEHLDENHITLLKCGNSSASKSSISKSIVSCGSLGANNNMAIVDPETLELCDDLKVGEIWLKGPSVAQGYWQKTELSAQTFNARIANSEDGSNWLRTGDLGFIHNQQLYVTGRSKDLIIIRGRNLYPQDIEQSAVTAHLELLKDGCAAISIETGTIQKLVLIHEVSRKGLKSLDLTEASTLIRRQVNQDFAVNVDDIVFIRPASLSRTSSGKIQHSKAKTDYLQNALSPVTLVPATIATVKKAPLCAPKEHTATVTQLATQINQQLTHHLGLATGHINHNTAFADLGLDSVGAIELCSKLSISMNCQIDPMLMWDHPTIGQLADYLHNEIENSAENGAKSNATQKPNKLAAEHETNHQNKHSNKQDTSIAIVGMAVNLPKQINTLDSFWQAMIEGQSIISPMPASRLKDWPIQSELNENKLNESDEQKLQSGFIDQVDMFDANFFALSKNEAVAMDPQQRLLLQTSWHALEDAGLNKAAISNSNCGVFIGLSSDDYSHLAKASSLFNDPVNHQAGLLGLGNTRSIAAGRIAYFLGCHGPAIAVDTACSSSAYAIHLACQAINNGEANLALAGGANLILQEQSYQVLQSLNALSPTHQCRTFSQDANGYVRGEGSAMIVLCSKQFAKQNELYTYAIINASHVNQDGHSNGLTAPNGAAQRALLHRTLQKAQLNKQDIGYIETHGTGTPLGDPIEVNAIGNIYGNTPLLLGAIKSQFGHLEAAAGVLSVIKTALAISKGQIPANLGFSQGNEHIKWQQYNLTPVNKAQVWPANKAAGVSSFGLSGTNVHMILTADTHKDLAQQQQSKTTNIWPIVKVSAQSKTALLEQIERFSHTLRTALTHKNPQQLNALISNSQYRSDFDWRACIDLSKNTANLAHTEPTFAPANNNPIVFMFTGQGANYSQMGQDLYQCAPVFAKRIDDANNWLNEYTNQAIDLSAIMFEPSLHHELAQPRFAQFSLYVLQIALVDWLASLHITPQAVIGHSIGEFAAAYCAGVIDAATGYQIVYERGALSEQLIEPENTNTTSGAMLAVKASVKQLIGDIAPKQFSLDIAAINSPNQTVVSGASTNIKCYEAALNNSQIQYQALNTTHAFHSQLMAPMSDAFKAELNKHQYNLPNIHWFSTVTANNINGNTKSSIDSQYWINHLQQGVLFEQGFNQLTEHLAENLSQTNFIEIGPKAVLSALIASKIESHQLFSTLKGPSSKKSFNNNTNHNNNQQDLSNTLIRLWQKGYNLNWQGLNPLPPKLQQNHKLPNYTFDLKRHWLPESSIAKPSPANHTNINEHTISYYNQWRTLELDTNKTDVLDILVIAEQPDTLLARTLPAKTVLASDDIDNLTLAAHQQLIWCFNPSSKQHNEATDALLTLKRLLALNISRLWIVVNGLHSKDLLEKGQQNLSRTAQLTAVLWGACKSIAHEYPQKFASIIDIDANWLLAHPQTNHSTNKKTDIISQLLTHKKPAPAYRLTQQGLMIEQLKPVKNPLHFNGENQFENQHLLITGGSGALANMLCQYLLAQGAAKVTLASRKVQTQQPFSSNLGSKIEHLSLDVTCQNQVKDRLNQYHCDNSLDGIFHLAGVAADVCPLQSLESKQINQVLAPKVDGAWYLHLHSQHLKLKHFVLFSSIASLTGYAGQTAYSAANFYLDWLASFRQQQNLPALSINWGPWHGDKRKDTANKGMAGNELVNKAMSQMGVNLLEQNEALKAFSQAIENPAANVAIIDVKPEVINHYNCRHNIDSKTNNKLTQASNLLKPNDINQWLNQIFAKVLGESIENEQKALPLNRLGLDSINALDIKHAIFERSGFDIPIVQFLQGITYNQLLEQINAYLNDNNQTEQNHSADDILSNSKAPNPAVLSDPQKRLWLVNQWQQPSGLYNIHAAIKLTGRVNIDRLQRVFDALTQRHEVLRTRFITDDQQQPMQQVQPSLNVTIKNHQLAHSHNDERLHTLLRTLAHQVFDLNQGPLWSVDLIELNQPKPHKSQHHVLALTLDHIIADAWSMDVLIKDVMALYQQDINGQALTLAPLKVQYKDYAQWQQRDLTDKKLARLSAYWQQNLADFTPFELKTDYQRPSRQSLNGQCHRFSLSPATSQALVELAAKQGVTLYVLMLTLFKLYLHQQTGSKDITIGTDVANREQAQTRNLIGFFVNLLVLRSQFDGNQSFEQLLNQQAQNLRQAIEHQDMSFHRLVELLNRPRDASRSPLVQILFVLQNAQSQSLQLPDLDVQKVDFDQQVCRFDMALFFHQSSAHSSPSQPAELKSAEQIQFHGHWHYASALYKPERISTLASGFDAFINLLINKLSPSYNSSTRANKSTDSANNKPLLLEDIRMLQTPFKSTKSKAGFNRFKSQSMVKKPLANKPLVEKFPLVSGKTMPLVIKANNNDIDPFAWVKLNQEQIFADLQQHGALLFRDFGLKNAQDFEHFAQSICPTLFGDYGDLPKEKQGKKIYHSTPYPKDKAILYHNESSHMHQWPTKQFFFCVTPSKIGGATPIVDCREIYRQMDPSILAQFENKHLKYVRNFSRNLDVSWQNFFKTENPSEVEQKCQQAGINYQWLENDGLRTEEIRRAVTVHPQSGQKSFFNQIQLHHSAFLPEKVRASLLDIAGVENLPRNVYFGDGSPISDDIALYTLELYERLAVRFDWQQGDLVMVDNMAVAHARDPFEGERKINVAMAQMQSQQGQIVLPEPDSNQSSIVVPQHHYNNLVQSK